MKRLLFLATFFLLPLGALSGLDRYEASPIPLSVTEGSSSGIVDGCVGAISGTYFESHQLMAVPGPEPIIIECNYASIPKFGWSQGICSSLNIKNYEVKYGTVKDFVVRYTEPSGSTSFLSSGLAKAGGFTAKLNMKTHGKGVTNASQQEISGKTNPKNTYFETNFKSPDGKKEILLKNGAGESHWFFQAINEVGGFIDKKGKVHHTQRMYYLNHLDKPNQQSIWVDFKKNDPKRTPQSIRTVSKNGGADYGKVNLSNFNDGEKNNFKRVYTSTDNRVATCIKCHRVALDNENDYENDEYYSLIKRPNAPDITFDYRVCPKKEFLFLSKRSYPENRSKEIEYYLDGVSETNKQYQRVKALKAPVGINGAMVTTHNFQYQINGDESGVTTVTNANGHINQYSFNSKQRLTCVRKHCLNKIISRENFVWGKESSPDEGNLVQRELVTPEGVPLITRNFTYDKAGNVTHDSFKGKITGLNSIDTKTKYCTYSNDGFNLLLSEVEDNKTTTYTYLPSSDLVASKITRFNDGSQSRQFHIYDSKFLLVKTVLDDGLSGDINDLNGVTKRLITKITPKSKAPCFGFPEVVEECFVEDGQEYLLKKTVSSYSVEGWLTRQDVYGADGKLSYSIQKDYDSHGNIICEVDPIGQIVRKKYDLNDNLIRKEGPGNSHEEYVYDFGNRLIEEIVDFHDGTRHSTKHTYDSMGNKIATIDWSGNTTRYSYDHNGNVIETIFPDGAVEKRSYDIFNNLASVTDPNGHTKVVEYNVLNQPLQIVHADGSIESFTYTIRGQVKEEVGKNGSITRYSYDDQDRVVSVEKCDSKGQILSSEQLEYDSSHLLSKTNPNGVVTYFYYDGAGRLIRETCKGREKKYSYDALGRKYKTSEKLTEELTQYVHTITDFDALNRVVEERIETDQGQVLKKSNYEYDLDGNRTKVITCIDGKLSIDETQFNPDKKPIKHIDSLGNTTTIAYDYRFTNAQGKPVLQVISIDPLGVKTQSTYNIRGSPSEVAKWSESGELLSSEAYEYDPAGNKTKTTIEVVHQGNVLRTYSYINEYNAVNQLTACIEENTKTVKYVYNSSGQKEQTIKPDGIVLFNEYDPLGRLSRLHSSDKSVDYKYFYDPCSNLIQVDDIIHKTHCTRFYDFNNEVVKEVLNNGLEVNYERDQLGRITRVILPDQTGIEYKYDTIYLSEVTYKGYTHKYLERDLAGNLIKESLVTGLEAYKTYDGKSRVTAILTGIFDETGIKYDPVDNIARHEFLYPSKSFSIEYSYDSLNQLTSENGGHFTHKYENDSVRNRLKKDKEKYKIDFLNQIVSEDGNSYSHDANGNLTHKGNWYYGKTYTYDALDRLIKVSDGFTSTRYTYDSFNRRLTSDKEKFFYIGNIEVGKVESGKVTELRVLGITDRKDLGSATLIMLKGAAFVPFYDHCGNIIGLTDLTNKPVAQNFYSSFGEEETKGKVLSPWRYASKRKEGGLIHFGCRDYDPRIGRWLTPDPLGFEDGPNLYAYVQNNPLIYVDLHGLYGHPCGCGVPIWRWNGDGFTYNGQHHGRKKDQSERKVTRDKVFYASHFNKGTKVLSVGEKEIPNVQVIYVNGICNTLEDATSSANMLSKMGDGVKVNLVYNASHGFLNDVTRNVLTRCCYKMNSVADETSNLIRTFHKANPAGKILLFGHSDGGAPVRNCLMDLGDYSNRKDIHVRLFSTSTYVDDHLCGSIQHIESSRDFFVPRVDSAGRARCRHTIRTIQAHKNAGWIDHSFQSPTLKDAQNEIMMNLEAIGK